MDIQTPRPRIWAVAHKDLGELVTRIAPNYAHVADIRLVDQVLDDALPAARNLVHSKEVDAFLCTGAIGSRMAGEIKVPIALIQVTAFDMLRAIQSAASHSNRVALVSYGSINPELDEITPLINVELAQRCYQDYRDARKQVNLLVNEGYEVIVGPSIIVELAETAGTRGVLLHSQSSVRNAIERAIDTARFRLNEEARLKRTNAILEHLDEGVLTVDVNGAVQLINPAMEQLLGSSKGWIQGKHISEVTDKTDLEAVIRSGEPILGKVQRIGKKTAVANYIPIKTQGKLDGIVLTCRDASDIERADRRIRSHNRKRQFSTKYQLSDILGDSRAITEAKRLAMQFAQVDSTVLITGESGTGKELFAQGIHSASARKNRPFVAINCAALPESLLESELFGYEEGAFTGSRRGGKPGLMELAHKGTLFLDEIGDIPLSLQTRLLRVLQEREVVRLGGSDATPLDVRIIAATNKNLRMLVCDGVFREDLYFRINILNLSIPPLRTRDGDIRALASHLLESATRANQGITPLEEKEKHYLLDRLQAHAWPGNVRELENVIERLAVGLAIGERPLISAERLAFILPEIFHSANDLEASPPSSVTLRSSLLHREHETIQEMLQKNKGNRTKTSENLGISRTTLWRKLQKKGDA